MTYVIYKDIAVLKTQTHEKALEDGLKIRFVCDGATTVKSVSLRFDGKGETLTRVPIIDRNGDVTADIPLKGQGIYTVEIITVESVGDEYIERTINAQSVRVGKTVTGELICGPLVATNSPMLWNAMGVLMEMLIGHIDEHRNGYEVV